MFENMTYEYILKRALSNVPTQVDKRQGSVIYDAIAPCCAELAQAYIQLDIIINNAFADTAEREYLILRAKEAGIEPYGATAAVLKGEFDVAVDIGTRFNLEDLNYIVTEAISESGHTYKLECETKGTVGNTRFGSIIPISTVKGLGSAKITELLIPGEDTEDTEEFRKRYFKAVSKEAFGGNRADYINKVKAINGVGQVKVYRTPSGGGSVSVVITDSENCVPSRELVDEVKEILDPAEYEGLGYGEAPVGHCVSVEGADRCEVSVTAEWECESGAEVDTGDIIEVIKEYIDEVNSQWEEKENLKLYSAHIIARILDINGIVDVTSVTIGGGQSLEAEINEIFEFNTLNE